MEELRTELWRDSRPISEAVLGNRIDAVHCLLSETGLEVDLQSLNSRGESLLHMASVHCNPAIFRLLVPRVQSVICQVDSVGETALIRVVRSGSSSKSRYEAARILLLNVEIDWTTHNVNGQQRALQLAVQLGDADMCRLLLCEGRVDGMSALTRDHDGQLVTKDKPRANEEVVLQLLRQHVEGGIRC
jgi:ankyrin repeat protein